MQHVVRQYLVSITSPTPDVSQPHQDEIQDILTHDLDVPRKIAQTVKTQIDGRVLTSRLNVSVMPV
jgi:hypothetical protein